MFRNYLLLWLGIRIIIIFFEFPEQWCTQAETFNRKKDFMYDLLYAALSTSDDKHQYIEDGLDGFPAFGFHIGAEVKQPYRLHLPEKLPAEFTIVAIFKPMSSKTSYLFAVLNPFDTVVQLGLRISDGPALQQNISLVYTNSDDHSHSEEIAGVTVPRLQKKWSKVVIKVSSKDITFYLNCHEISRKTINRIPQELVLDTASTLYIAQAGPHIQEKYQGLMQTLRIYTGLPETLSECPVMENEHEEYQGSLVLAQTDDAPHREVAYDLPELRPGGEAKVPGNEARLGPLGIQGARDLAGRHRTLNTDGRKGDKGDPGPPGPEGVPGQKGDRGLNGIPGSKGDRGFPGSPGSPGLAGKNAEYPTHELDWIPRVTSSHGRISMRPGLPGPKGEPGSPGGTCINGSVGATGPKGSIGDTGPKGEKGDQGKHGNQGIQGFKGEPGSPGLPGGPRFSWGKDEFGSTVQKGEKGDPGPEGKPGPPGSPAYTVLNENQHAQYGGKGEYGSRGFRGDPGAKGEKGEKGVNGVRGMPGVEGARGFRGDRGERGNDGLPGLPGSPGVKGDRGERGPPGIPSIIASSDQITLKGEKGNEGKKGRRGRPGPPGPVGPPGNGAVAGGSKLVECPDKCVKGDIGPTGLPGLPGKDGRPGLPGSLRSSEALDSNFVPVVGPPGPPGPAGPPGAPGGFSINQRNGLDHTENHLPGSQDVITSESPPEALTRIVPGAVTFRNMETLTEMSSVSPVGTLAYVIDEEALILRIDNGWQYVALGSVISISTSLQPTMIPVAADPSLDISNLMKRIIMKTVKNEMRMAALNDPLTGDMRGIEGANYACHQQAKRAGLEGVFRAFLSSRVQNLENIVSLSNRNLPVVNLKGDILFNSWREMIKSNGAYFSPNPRIYSFNGKNILMEFAWSEKTIWHGSRKSDDRTLETSCDAWHASTSDQYGMGSPIAGGQLLESLRYPCNSKFVVLCIDVISDEIRNR